MADRESGRYPKQLGIMETQEVYDALEALWERHGLSQAEIFRRCIRAGLPKVRQELEREAREIARAHADAVAE